jgi:hypothetical protein
MYVFVQMRVKYALNVTLICALLQSIGTSETIPELPGKKAEIYTKTSSRLFQQTYSSAQHKYEKPEVNLIDSCMI